MSYAPSAHRAGAPLLLLPVQHKLSAVSVGEYDDGALLVRVAVARGKVIAQMGVHREGRQYLFLEEALYLLERGLLEVLCDGVPLTVQEAYALLADAQYPSKHRSESGGRALHSAALRSPLDAYIAYAHLKQRGCTVLRPSALLRPSASQPSQPPAVQRAVLAAVALVHPLFPTATGAAVHDEEEAAIHERLQARFCRAAPPPCPPASRVFALQELLDAVDLFFVWSPQQPPQRPVVFSRRQPPLPDHILIINRSAHRRSPQPSARRACWSLPSLIFCASRASSVRAVRRALSATQCSARCVRTSLPQSLPCWSRSSRRLH